MVLRALPFPQQVSHKKQRHCPDIERVAPNPMVLQLHVVACAPTNIQLISLALGAPISPYSSGCYPTLGQHIHIVGHHDHIIHVEEIHLVALVPHMYDQTIMLLA